MPLTVDVETTGDELEDWGTIARIEAPDGTAVLKAHVTKWQLVVFDLQQQMPVYSLKAVLTASNNTNAAKPSAPEVVGTALRTDGYWKKGGAGYTFLHFLCRTTTNVRANDGMLVHAPPFRPVGGRVYLAEYLLEGVWGIIQLTHRRTIRPAQTVGVF